MPIIQLLRRQRSGITVQSDLRQIAKPYLEKPLYKKGLVE
jgi:hypothetical protein